MSGSVKVAAYGTIGGVLRFDIAGIGVAGVQVSQPLRDAIFPVRRREGGIATGMALHNREEEAAVVSCRLMKNGAVLEEVEITLAAGGQVARFIGEVFTGTDTSDFVGLVRCTAEGVAQFTGMALELDAGNRIFTTLPVVEVNRGRAGEAALDFAHFANGASIVSEMVFMNLETQPSGPPPTPFHQAIPPTRPVIYFYDQEGNPIDPGIAGGSHGRSGDHRRRSPEHPVGDGAAGRTHDHHPRPGRVSVWIGAGGLGWSHRRGPCALICPASESPEWEPANR